MSISGLLPPPQWERRVSPTPFFVRRKGGGTHFRRGSCQSTQRILHTEQQRLRERV